jgi:DNA-binding CsgD family transcriptional regulator
MLRVQWLRTNGTRDQRWLDPGTPVMTVGRDPGCAVPVVGYEDVSWNHADLVRRDGEWFIFDKSRYGTSHLRGGEMVAAASPIRPGDVAKLADVVQMQFVDVEPPRSLELDSVSHDVRTANRPRERGLYLSPRQREILRAFAEDPGRTRAEVGARLGISVWAVKKHLQDAYVALELPPQRGGMIPLAVAKASALGLLS